jgi:GMP synthase (glutamine-hydrolysing)
MAGRACAIRHVAFEDLGFFAEVLSRHGFAIEYVEAAAASFGKMDPLGPDLLVVLGGPIGAYEDDAYPFLADEVTFIEARLRADRPTLGICLGAQLMARALGAKVVPGGRKEIGWAPLRLTDAGRASSLRHLDGAHVLHWHGDTFDLPKGAVLLASTDLYPHQAFAWGRRALALQFHVEVTAPGLEHWYIGHSCEIAATPGLSVAALRRDSEKYAPGLERQGREFLEDWLKAALDS